MTKTIRISLYVIVLLIGYFTIVTVLDSCKSKSDNKSELLDEDLTSTEEDDFFEDFEENTEDNQEDNHHMESDDIDYNALDKKLKGQDQNSNDWVEEKTTPKKPRTPKKTAPTKRVPTPKHTSNPGKYMVVAGSFLVEDNADKLISKLKRMGYTNAETAVFDLSKYYTVIAYRNNSRSESARVVGNLKKKGIDCYVHTRQ